MTDLTDIPALMADLGGRAKAAAATLGFASADSKTTALNAAADAVWTNRAEILAANQKDLAYGHDKGLSDAMMDRLMLDEPRIQGMVDGLRAVAGQDDPVGQVLADWDRPTGLQIQRVRTPLGVDRIDVESAEDMATDRPPTTMRSGPRAAIASKSGSNIDPTTGTPEVASPR